MYRTTKKKYVRRMSISAAVAFGAIATGAGIGAASASASTTKSVPTAVVASKVGAHATGTAPGPMRVRGPGGVVTALSGTSLTVKNQRGTEATFELTSATTVTKDRVSAPLSALAVGDQVRITPSAAGSAAALRVDIEQPSVMGKVTAVSGDTITVTGRDGVNETVIVSGATTYSKGGASASVADVTIGTPLFAEGTFAPGATTTLDATTVGVGMVPHQGRFGQGHPDGPGPASAHWVERR